MDGTPLGSNQICLKKYKDWNFVALLTTFSWPHLFGISNVDGLALNGAYKADKTFFHKKNT